jgi:PIN domain nuclease of toxin-antitoxin system
MRLLLDTNILLLFFEERLDRLDRARGDALNDAAADLHASVLSLWEIAIKYRLGKLPLRPPLRELPGLLERMGLALLDIKAPHVLAEVEPLPPTRDPFDRLLLSQCLVENLRLVTLDRALAAHPLAWRPA